MEGKLIKEIFGGQVCYTLFKDGEKTPYAKDGKGHGYMLLSVKNCEEIENGYYIEDLVDEKFKPSDKSIYGFNNWDFFLFEAGFKKGFQKALEILGDKKFNYDHLDKMFTCGKLYQDSKNEAYCFDNVLSKFEKNEWDVEIVTKPYTEVSEGFNLAPKREPKLDENNCLILKPIKNV